MDGDARSFRDEEAEKASLGSVLDNG